MKFEILGEPVPKGAKKASDEELAQAYSEIKSVWKVAEKFGMSGQAVHERLVKVGISLDGNGQKFTKDDEKFLLERYVLYRNAGKLEALAKEMGRSKFFLCRKAGKLNLTDKNSAAPYISKWKYMTEDMVGVIFEDFKKSRYTLGDYCRKRGYGKNGFVEAMKRFFPAEYENLIELKAPKQTMYRFGRSFEYRTRDDLRKKGYFVMRAPASRSPLDLIAFKVGQVLFVQCKRAGALCPQEWNELYDLARSVDVMPILAFMPAETLKGVEYRLLVGRKLGQNKQKQPMEVFVP